MTGADYASSGSMITFPKVPWNVPNEPIRIAVPVPATNDLFNF